MSRYYGMCQRYQGKIVRISHRDGNVHVGRIVRVTPHSVFIQPVRQRGGRGYGLGYYGGGYGGWYGYGPAYGIGLGFITGVALAGLLLW
ncbi:hypothetical protein LRR81_04610 [Metabacillus sp. GX 13764]|uniref:hypothetical protein n=1 Tax=Metabacillus kandeliae TaxID=2900151 RepID=UPI001E4DE553|nr:hypothetical protein [Metabacillus kandeliae]MCD7033503.1 hypothetical protein [Metabacillus kandeliae]